MLGSLKRWLLGRQKTHRQGNRRCTDEACITKADEELHQMARLIHVLEWEAYGKPKRREGERNDDDPTD